MKFGRRLSVLLEMIPNNTKILADIGADHGYLTTQALKQEKAQFVYATDISAMSLDKTRVLVEKCGMQDRCECMVSDGFDAFDKNVVIDCSVIAGMGGNEIVKILSKSMFLTNVKHFLLQPVQDAYTLRKYLSNNSFEIIEDRIVCEKGKYYACILCKVGKAREQSEYQSYLGQNCDKDYSIDFMNFLRYTYDVMNSREQYLTTQQKEIKNYCQTRLNEKF